MIEEIHRISPETAQVLAHNIRWKIMKLLLREEPMYAKRIAEILEISESKVHYHVKKLIDAGLITQTGIQVVKQGRAKLFKPIANEYLLSLLKSDRTEVKTAFNMIIKNFYYKTAFLGKIITGSAEPHGKYDAISRDGYLAGELCWYLGSYTGSKTQKIVPNYVLTDLEYEKSSHKKEDSLILIGGHITNTLTAYYNETFLKPKFGIYFLENQITDGVNNFSLPEHALIAFFRNPESASNWILILAGVRSLGTKAAIYSIVSDCYEVLEDKGEFVTVIKGESLNGTHINSIVEVLHKSIN